MGVTQVVNADVLKTCAFRYRTPRPVKVCARLLGIIAGNDVGSDARSVANTAMAGALSTMLFL
jgi:hypothetical protein